MRDSIFWIHSTVFFKVSQSKEKLEDYERRLREEGLSSSGVGSIHSDQDSGKHSDNSLVISR